jgi:ribose-phosphate pyrophosphokinase
MHLIGDVKGKTAILVDDMVDTAGTLTKGAQAVMDHGANRVFAACTHPIMSGPAVERLTNSPLEQILVTDTIPLSDEAKACKKIKVVTVSALFAEAIQAIHNDASISRLFH